MPELDELTHDEATHDGATLDACQDALDQALQSPTGEALEQLVDHLHELLGDTTQMAADDWRRDAQDLLAEAAEAVVAAAVDADDLTAAMWVPQMGATVVATLARHPACSPAHLRELAHRVRDVLGHLGPLRALPGAPRRVALLADLYGRQEFPVAELLDRWEALTPAAQAAAEALAATWRPCDTGFLDVAERTAA